MYVLYVYQLNVCKLYYIKVNLNGIIKYDSTRRLTSSELQGQEESACSYSADATTSVLFTGPNTVKFASALTRSFWALSFSYYRVT